MSLKSDWSAGLPKPNYFVVGEMRRKGVEDALVIVIEPFDFLGQEHVDENRCLVDGTEGERLELQELAELRFLIRHDKKRILDTHAELTSKIDTWFVCDGHS